jgi:hypothetical protein
MRKLLAVASMVTIVGLAVAAVAAQNTPASQAAPAAKAAPAATPASCGPTPPADLKNVAKGSRCFELRTYTLRPGGRGDLDLLHKRFRDATLMYFKKYNMEVVGFWQPVAKPDQLVYLLAFKDAATRDAAWAAFQADPGWIKARTDMTVDLTVNNEFMIATDYGPMK